MYLHAYIGHWTNHDWQKFFSNFPLLLEDEREHVKKILRGTKEEIESSFDTLYELGIINGLWPFWFPWPVRVFLRWAFPYFRWEWHDLMYLIGGTPEDRKKSDLWMLKYTIGSIMIDITEAIQSRRSILIVYKCTLSLYFRTMIAVIFYIKVRAFGFLSFRKTPWTSQEK